MKKKIKQILSVLLVTVMLVGIAPVGGIDFTPKAKAMDLSSYKVGDLIEFGSYPQSKVTDETLIDELDSRLTDDMWVSYGYYSGTGEWDDGEMTSSDFMKYADIIYNGNKYRAVMFSNFRSNCTGDKQSSYGSYQVANGYYTYNTYFFKFEPLTWRILDPSEGYVMCNSIIDAQTFQNIVYTNGEESYNSKSCEKFASDWKTSSLRRWLNEDFYNTAFTDTEKSEIGVSLLENKFVAESTYDGENTSDKIFPISYNDAMNSTYGLRPADVIYDKNFNELAQLIGTDYAKCQGLCVHNYEEGDYTGFSGWWLRSPDSVRSNSATFVDDDGNPYDYGRVNYINGIVPAFKFNPKYKLGDLIEFGSYPQSEVKDSELIAKIEAAGASISWIDYNYYAGTGNFADGNMKPVKDMMLYKDITYNGNKYRAVKINQYRPCGTGDTSSASNSYQDDNGYYTGNIYYFKYEPLTWRVLDPNEGYVMCNNIIDSQAYQNYTCKSEEEYYNSNDCASFASNWSTSSLKQFLNNDFYNIAFSTKEKKQIGKSHQENRSAFGSALTTSDGVYDCIDTYEKIFIVSYYDVLCNDYGFSTIISNSKNRLYSGTDYAKCQGLYCSDTFDCRANWWLRSCYGSYAASSVGYDGFANYSYLVNSTYIGIFPAFKFNPKTSTSNYKTIEFGSYPQSEVKDEALLSRLNGSLTDDMWVSYGYYSGSIEPENQFLGTAYSGYGSMKQGDWMKYADITYNGEKYRAVKFSKYRPYCTCSQTTDSTNFDFDFDDFDIHWHFDLAELGAVKYYVNNTYWFKYDPIKWRILDSDKGLVVSENIIDSQAYSNTLYYNAEEYMFYNDSEMKTYANDYATSSIRKWLNDDFYNTAFTDYQKSKIKTTELDNSSVYSDKGEDYNIYDSETTFDKVFLLSYSDITNPSYGFSGDPYDEEDETRDAMGTGYAFCQGLMHGSLDFNDENELNFYEFSNYPWILRTAGDYSKAACGILGGKIITRMDVDIPQYGVRPAMVLSDFNEHTHTLKHITVPASCTVNGMEYDICTECGETFNEKVIPMGHKLNHVVVPSTCKVAGMEYDICSECGETFNEKTLPLAAHTWSEWTVVKEATTTAEGQEKRTCSVCDKVETRAIEKLKVIKDDKTGIEINYNDEYDSDTEIKVEEQFSGKSFQLINTEFGKVNSKIYDIATYKDGVKVQPNGEITVKVPLPDGFTTNKVFVCYVDSVSGKVTKIPCEVKDGYVIFKTNHFSEYAIVEQSANVKSVSVSDIKLNYKKSATIKPTIKADEGAKYTVKYSSSNTKVATVDENGKVYAAKKGSATITCTVTDSNGNTVQDTCKVTVKYSFGQWLIKILLFGWIWY